MTLFGFAMISAGVPWAMTWPPCSPAPGPMSMIQSAAAMVSSSLLHHDNRIAEAAQVEQCVNQLGIIPLVQADGRLVENIQNAGQPGADLRRQANALRFAARQGPGAPVKRQVAEADVEEKAKRVRISRTICRPIICCREVRCSVSNQSCDFRDAEGAEVADVQATQKHRKRFGLQPLAGADGTRLFRLKTGPSTL